MTPNERLAALRAYVEYLREHPSEYVLGVAATGSLALCEHAIEQIEREQGQGDATPHGEEERIRRNESGSRVDGSPAPATGSLSARHLMR